MSNIVNVNVKYQQGRTEPLFQYDYGQVLKINGIELPLAYEVHFADSPNSATSITKIGNADGVDIPDEILYKSGAAYAWLFLHSGENDGETRVVITIPIVARAKITDPAVTPAQEDVITQTIAELNVAVGLAETYAVDASEAADDAAACVAKYPQIGENRNWYVYDPETNEMIDSGVLARGTQGAPGESASIWFSTSAPVNYAGVGLIFYKSGLHGQTAAQKVNEMVFYGAYYYRISELRDSYVIVTDKTSITGG